MNGCLLDQVIGEISFNKQPMRPFSQSICLAHVQKSPFHYFVQNDIFRFPDFETDDEDSMSDEMSVECETMPVNGETELTEQPDRCTQCTEDVEPFDQQMLQRKRCDVLRMRRFISVHPKMRLSGDSGLSSDAQKVIIDTQLDTQLALAEETPSTIEQPQQSQLLQQPIEKTYAEFANRNIEFGDDQAHKNDNQNVDEKTDESSNSSSFSDGKNGKDRDLQQNFERKSKHDISHEKSIDDSIKEKNEIRLQAKTNHGDYHLADDNQNKPTECLSENVQRKQPNRNH